MTDQPNLNELAHVFARGYLRLLKQSAQIESETGSIALALPEKTALSVTTGLTTVRISEKNDEH